ncbi:MAG: hypothetical protein HOE25_04950, partial [Flavobacteriales bacterium]|nr:hypothetical protein [Flavobacteriales bacterium]
MKKKEKFHLLYSVKREVYYNYIRIIRLFSYLFNKNNEYQFLFILSPPYAGSTMLNQLISSSDNVSCNNNLGTREGQLLPAVKKFMFQKNRWNENVQYPWEEVRKTWLRYWDYSKPVFLDKSIPNIMRVDEIEKVFSPIKYMCMVRNPYAQVEGLMRRNKQDAKSAAEFAIKCLYYQSKNRKRENILFFTYEQLCDNGQEISQKMIEFIPELSDLDMNIDLTSHNFKKKGKMKMANLNDEKIAKISETDFEIINSIFEKDKDLLKEFGYKIINNDK